MYLQIVPWARCSSTAMDCVGSPPWSCASGDLVINKIQLSWMIQAINDQHFVFLLIVLDDPSNQ